MIESRRPWLDWLMSPDVEGGFVNDPHDRGGATNHGVTQKTLSEWRGRPVTVEEVKNLTLPDAESCALAMFWNPIRGDMLPGGIDLMVADFAFHSGPGRAAKMLQRTVGCDADGMVGEQTVGACRSAPDARIVIADLHAARLVYLQGLDTWPRYGKGWTRRVDSLRDLALTLVRPPMVEAGVPRSRTVLGGAAALAGGLSALLAALPDLLRTGQAAHAAASSGDWLPVLAGLAAAIGGGVAVHARISDYYRGLHAGRQPIEPPDAPALPEPPRSPP